LITLSDTEKTQRATEKHFLGVSPCSSVDLCEISRKRGGVPPENHTKVVAILAFFSLLIPSSPTQAQNIIMMSQEERSAYFAKVNAESYQNWMKMIDLLQIELPKNLPPPSQDPNRPKFTFQKQGSSNWYDRSGNTYTRSAWGTWNNYDEAKANPYPNLPNPLTFNDGKPVKNAEMWWKERRPQIVRDFDNEIYGWAPKETPPVRWEVVGKRDTTIGSIPATISQLIGHVDNSMDPKINVDIKLTLTLPARAKHPVPVILEFGFVFPPGFHFPGMPEPKGPSWEEQVLDKGWGCAVYDPTSVQQDNGAGLSEGIIGLMNKGEPRSPDQWGALRAWAWGASRILDYFETDRSVDAKMVGIEGVSRYGKAVLLTMACDRRFAIVLVGSSGKGGAALFRRDFGEDMGNICSSGEYHWFAGNLLKYVLHPDELSVDSNELIALCAPRPVFISCGSPEKEGNWVDDRGQFMAEVAAGPVYKLLGEKDLGTDVMPPMGTPLTSGTLAFRQHHYGHTVGPNWPYFLKFAEKYFGGNAGSDSK
jgi:(4-O-methyl)-D-glucuronate---lignin esterase